jgi:hypothetical protein
MAEFTVIGERNGVQQRVTWRNGEVSGADEASQSTADWVRQLAQLYEGRSVGLPGLARTNTEHLRSPYSAYAIIRSVFPGKTTLDRSLPRVPDVPPGAVR